MGWMTSVYLSPFFDCLCDVISETKALPSMSILIVVVLSLHLLL